MNRYIRRSWALVFSLMIISCGAPTKGNDLSYKGFYYSANKIISTFVSPKQPAEYFVLAGACKDKKQYKKAITAYANSAFRYKNADKVRAFPGPVYAYMNSMSLKTEYYNDAVFEIAALFFEYREFAYVVKFCDLVSTSDLSLKRETVLLKIKVAFVFEQR